MHEEKRLAAVAGKLTPISRMTRRKTTASRCRSTLLQTERVPPASTSPSVTSLLKDEYNPLPQPFGLTLLKFG